MGWLKKEADCSCQNFQQSKIFLTMR